MAASALRKNREEVSTDLSIAGFDKKQSLAIVQAVADTAAAMDLATRADLRREVGRLEEKIDGVKGEVGGLKADVAVLKADVADLKDRMSRLEGRMDGFGRELKEIRSSLGRVHRLIFWSSTIGFGAIACLIAAFELLSG